MSGRTLSSSPVAEGRFTLYSSHSSSVTGGLKFHCCGSLDKLAPALATLGHSITLNGVPVWAIRPNRRMELASLSQSTYHPEARLRYTRVALSTLSSVR